ncbi:MULTISPECIES: hypothetical protein [Oscillatoriales]|uniref:Uncharacterized protein n=1 Tax=Aerosakkonema funiforme FACHB-1375 TaxID=2949571 RepID=A0A926VIU6_9CYAN|nr:MULTISPECIES: hypothetical protein [Oscillatoriales]MBD2184639.1 hypothetical protein [Aerosakkonema funiforme FACHB-1375]
MGIQKTVFGSVAEKKNYDKLSRQWGDKYYIYHNLPFLQVLNTEGISLELTYRQLEYIKKTSIDYIFCDNEGKPLIALDFDGMLQGFNVGLDYHKSQSHPSLDKEKEKNRENGFKLKLRIAHDSSFPLFIVGSKEFKDFSTGISLTIVDAIIGEILASKAFNNNLLEPIPDFKDILEKTGLSETLYDEFIDIYEDETGEIILDYNEVGKWVWRDWKCYLRRKTNLETNPIDAKIKELRDCLAEYIVKDKSANTIIIDRQGELINNNIEAEYLRNHLMFDHSFNPPNSNLDFAIYLEVKCSINTEKFGLIESTASCPNFKSIEFRALSLLEKVAELVVLTKISKKVDKT